MKNTLAELASRRAALGVEIDDARARLKARRTMAELEWKLKRVQKPGIAESALSGFKWALPFALPTVAAIVRSRTGSGRQSTSKPGDFIPALLALGLRALLRR